MYSLCLFGEPEDWLWVVTSWILSDQGRLQCVYRDISAGTRIAQTRQGPSKVSPNFHLTLHVVRCKLLPVEKEEVVLRINNILANFLIRSDYRAFNALKLSTKHHGTMSRSAPSGRIVYH